MGEPLPTEFMVASMPTFVRKATWLNQPDETYEVTTTHMHISIIRKTRRVLSLRWKTPTTITENGIDNQIFAIVSEQKNYVMFHPQAHFKIKPFASPLFVNKSAVVLAAIFNRVR